MKMFRWKNTVVIIIILRFKVNWQGEGIWRNPHWEQGSPTTDGASPSDLGSKGRALPCRDNTSAPQGGAASQMDVVWWMGTRVLRMAISANFVQM